MSNRAMMTGMMKKDTATAKMIMGNMMQIMENDFAMCNMMGDMMMSNQHMMSMMQGMKGGKGGMMGGRMIRGEMMMCPIHGGMKMSDEMEGEEEEENGTSHNH
jgi:hypothetical protein